MACETNIDSGSYPPPTVPSSSLSLSRDLSGDGGEEIRLPSSPLLSSTLPVLSLAERQDEDSPVRPHVQEPHRTAPHNAGIRRPGSFVWKPSSKAQIESVPVCAKVLFADARLVRGSEKEKGGRF